MKSHPVLNRASLIPVMLSLTACVFFAKKNTHPIDPANYGGLVQVACVGDSITYGSSLPNRAREAYPSRLQELLGDRWEVRNFGVSGATMLRSGNKPYIRQVPFGDARNYNPDVVIILLGTNDSKPTNWETHGGDFVADTLALIENFDQLPSRPRIFLALPPPVNPNRFSISEENLGRAIRPALEMIAREKQIALIDLNGALRRDLDTLHDGVHPDARGAELIARAAAAALTGKPVSRN